MLILAASLALNVYLGIKVRAGAPALHSPPTIAVGTRAPNLYAEKIDGTKIVIDWAGSPRPWILYIFSPACVWCQRNTKNFDTIVRDRQTDYQIIGLSITSSQLSNYLSAQPAYTVYTNPDMAKSPLYSQAATPATYLISNQGIVQAVWPGAYTGEMKKRIEAMLNVQLPGLKAD